MAKYHTLSARQSRRIAVATAMRLVDFEEDMSPKRSREIAMAELTGIAMFLERALGPARAAQGLMGIAAEMRCRETQAA